MQETGIFLYVMEMVGSAIFLIDSKNANRKKRFLRVLYFTFIKKEYHIQIELSQASSHQSYSTERKLKPEYSK